MPGLVLDHCNRCGMAKEPGAVFYLVRITLTCDFDGGLVDMNPGEIKAKISEEMRKGLELDEDELMNEVYHELYFYLCKSCRDKFVKKPF